MFQPDKMNDLTEAVSFTDVMLNKVAVRYILNVVWHIKAQNMHNPETGVLNESFWTKDQQCQELR